MSIITLNENELNTSIKRQRLKKTEFKKDPTICCSQETHFKYRAQTVDNNKIKKIYHATLNVRKLAWLY